MAPMPPHELIGRTRPVTRSQLVRDLQALGVAPGGVLMVHTRMSSLGWLVGGTQTVVEALLEAVGERGTLMAYAGWEDDPYHLAEWPEERRQAYLEELPPFHPLLSAADPDFGRIPERIRTWPGARASDAHVGRMVAVGARAEWLTADAHRDHVFGPGSPLARLVEAEGQVLLLGAPMETLTVLHHAEALVDSPEKRLISYRIPFSDGEHVVWREICDHETSSPGAFRYERVVPKDVDAFEVIGREALAAGVGRSGRVGEAECHLFPAAALVRFAVAWIEARFGAADGRENPSPASAEKTADAASASAG